jgi:hypothetical protein
MPEGKPPIVWHLELMTANPAEAIRWTKAAPQVLAHATVEVVGTPLPEPVSFGA